MTAGRLRYLRASAATFLALCAPALALAQTPDRSADQVAEVIVTAERREGNLQETPISVTAISSAVFADAGIRRVEDFAALLPNVYIDDRNLRTQTIAIRGISADLNNPGLDQGVGIFLDGIYLGRATAANANLFDLERVEVLRGPQGTLYGKNTIAGAINYITRKPNDDYRAEVDAGYGNHSAVFGNAVVSGPLVPGKLFAAIGTSVDQRQGLIRNLATGTREDDRNGQSGKAQIVALPTDDLEIVLRGDISRDRTNSGANEVLVNGAFAGTPLAQPAPASRTISQNRDTVQNRDAGGVSGEVNWRGPVGTLTSLTGYRASTWFNIADNDFTVLDMLASGVTEKQHQVSQEVRFASTADGPFDYILGAYYFHQRLDADSQAIIGPDLGVYPTVQVADIFALVDTDSYAAFAHGTYRFNDQLSLTAGVRYTHEKKAVDQRQAGDPFGVLLATTATRRLNRSEGATSPTVSVNYKPTQDLFLYATYSQGYKSGGFNVFSITPTNDAEYSPEHVDNYELGAKSEFLDHRLRLNVAGYWMDYTGLQVNQLLLVGGIPRFQTSNAAKARSKGFEIDAEAKPMAEVTLNATYGYNDATFVSYRNATQTGADYTGHTLPRAPRSNASAAAQLDHPLSDGLSLFARAEVAYRSKVFFTADNGLSQKPVTLLNARVGLEAPSGRWGVYAWGRNLGKVDYAIDKEPGVIVPGQVTEALAPPRTFGVEIRARY